MQILKDNQTVTESEITEIQVELLSKLKIDKEITLIMDNIIRALPADQAASDTTRVNIEGALRSGVLQAWAITGKTGSDESEQLLGFMSTQLRRDEFTQHKYLLVYSLNASANLSITAWKYLWEILELWGQKQDIHHVVGYTRVPRIIEIVRAVGGTADSVEIYIPMGRKEG